MTENTHLVVETQDLGKRYGERIVAVDGLNLEVRRGEVYGFLGPNGAGKTTTLRMLLGLIRPTTGAALVLGARPGTPEGLGRVGALIETPTFYPYLSGRDNLRVLARYAGVSETRIATVLEEVDLTARAGDRFRTYSLGMKQRLGIAAALLKDPELLILDEPTNGMDPVGIAEMRPFIRSLGRGDRTVLLSSHLMSEVEQVCDRVGVISHGRLVGEGTVDELRGREGLWVRAEPLGEAERLLGSLRGVDEVARDDGGLRIAAEPAAAPDDQPRAGRGRDRRERAPPRARVPGEGLSRAHQRRGGSMTRIVTAELLLLGKRASTWILLGIWAALALTFAYVVPYVQYTNDPCRSPLSDLLPESLVGTLMAGFPFFGGVLALMLGVLTVGSEYGWGTLKTLFTQGPGRLQVFGAKLIAVAAALALFVLVAYALGAVSSWAIAAAEGADVVVAVRVAPRPRPRRRLADLRRLGGARDAARGRHARNRPGDRHRHPLRVRRRGPAERRSRARSASSTAWWSSSCERTATRWSRRSASPPTTSRTTGRARSPARSSRAARRRSSWRCTRRRSSLSQRGSSGAATWREA